LLIRVYDVMVEAAGTSPWNDGRFLLVESADLFNVSLYLILDTVKVRVRFRIIPRVLDAGERDPLGQTKGTRSSSRWKGSKRTCRHLKCIKA